MINAAIVGLGRWGRSLVGAVQGRSDDIRFVLGHTRSPAKAQAFCADKGIVLVDDLARLLADPGIDAVVLATPHSRHEAQALAAIAAGKHVFVEKPITLDQASAARVVEAARRAGIVLAVGFNRRFHPSLGEVRARLADRRLGDLVSMVGQHTTGANAFIAADNWRADPQEAPAGAMTAVGVHLLDHMIELAGPVREVHCATESHSARGGDDTTTVLLRFKSGVTGVIFCTVASAANFNFTVYGTRGVAEISGAQLEAFRFVPASDRPPGGVTTAPPAQTVEHRGFDMLHAELTELARCVREKKPYPVALDQVLHGMAVFDAAVRSAETGTIVTL